MRRIGMTRRVLLGAAGAAAMLALAATGGSAQDKPTIKLGFIGPLSGGNAPQGLGARNGFLLAIDQANEAGYPYHVEGVVLDDAADPQTGVGAALKLVNDPDVVAATGHWNSAVALATIPIFARYKMPFIVWGAISPKITDQNLLQITRNTPTLVNEDLPLAEWAAKKLGVSKVAIVSDTSDYGVANAKVFAKFFKQAGGQVVSTDMLPVGTTDFRAVLTKIKDSGSDVLYYGGVITEAGLLRKQERELGIDLPMIGISGFYDPEFIKLAGDAAEGTMVSFPVAASNSKLDKLEADYKARGFSDPPSPYTKYAYDAVGIILAAIKKVGFEDKEALANAIRNISYDGVVGTTTFDKNGQTQVPIDVIIKAVKNGKWIDLK